VFILAELQSERSPESVPIRRAWGRIPMGAQVPVSPGR